MRGTLTAFALALALALCIAAGAAMAEESPVLGVYVTGENKDAYVALYGSSALELAGCATESEARALLELPPEASLRETTLDQLHADFGFGTWPRIPCLASAFDIDWPATTPVWADVEASGYYYIQAPSGGYFAVPARCNALKSALAIRARLQLPGVLHGLVAPANLGTPRLVISCGTANGTGGTSSPTAEGANAGWSLHRFETFLSADSTGDMIYVARYASSEQGSVPSYLPILKLNGKLTSEIILQGGDAAAGAESALRRLLGVSADVPVTQLGFEAVSAIRDAPYVDLCVTNCEGYAFAHAAFLKPGVDLGVSALAPSLPTAALDRLGTERLTWPFAEGRRVAFTGCQELTTAMGLSGAISADWLAATAGANDAGAALGPSFDCTVGGARVCSRRVGAGGVLTPAMLGAGPDCAGADHLRIELAAAILVPQALLLQGLPFKVVEFWPAAGVARSALTVAPALLSPVSATCVLSPANALFAANGLPRLELHRIDLRRQGGAAGGEVLAMQVENGTLVLDDVTIGADAEGTSPVSRGINLCLADLYDADSKIAADSLAVQGLSAHVMISGRADAHASLARSRYGLLLSSSSLAQIQFASIVSANPIVLRGAQVRGASVSLVPTDATAQAGTAIMLERASSAEFLTSTISGFRCAASFVDAASRVTLTLPGNDIDRDNAHQGCGPGKFSLIE